MSDCVRCTRKADFCAHHVAQQEEKLRAEVRDLKARLKAARRAIRDPAALDPVADIERATDLRRKNWRTP